MFLPQPKRYVNQREKPSQPKGYWDSDVREAVKTGNIGDPRAKAMAERFNRIAKAYAALVIWFPYFLLRQAAKAWMIWLCVLGVCLLSVAIALFLPATFWEENHLSRAWFLVAAIATGFGSFVMIRFDDFLEGHGIGYSAERACEACRPDNRQSSLIVAREERSRAELEVLVRECENYDAQLTKYEEECSTEEAQYFDAVRDYAESILSWYSCKSVLHGVAWELVLGRRSSFPQKKRMRAL